MFNIAEKSISMYVHLHLLVPVYLKKYLSFRFGKEYKLSQCDWLGIVIGSSLSSKRSVHYHYACIRRDASMDRYKILIHASSCEKRGYFLTQEQEQRIVRAVDHNFRSHLFEYAVMNKELYGLEYKVSIGNVLDSYGIDEEDGLCFSSLLRDFSRKREKIESSIEKSF